MLTIGDDIELFSDELNNSDFISKCQSQSKSLIQNSDESLTELKCKRKSYTIKDKFESIRTQLSSQSLLFLYITFIVTIIVDNVVKIELTIQSVGTAFMIAPLLLDLQPITIFFPKVTVHLGVFLAWQFESNHIIPNNRIRLWLITVIVFITIVYLLYLYVKVWIYFYAGFDLLLHPINPFLTELI